MITKKSIPMYMIFLLLLLTLTGCNSNRREELNLRLQEGETLLAGEKYQEAEVFFENLLAENQDNITVMEKLDFSRVMKRSRESLLDAEEYFRLEAYREAHEALKDVSGQDEKGTARKEELLKDMREAYLEEARKLSEERHFESAMDHLREYLEIRGKDPEAEGLLAVIEEESLKPPEPVVEEVVKKIIVLDPGHQREQDREKEPVGPGSEKLKDRMSRGTRGIVTGTDEYVLNLEVSLKLRDRLLEEGYEVIMTRTDHEVSLSNRERAELANAAHADLYLMIHANGSNDRTLSGIMTIYPSEENPFAASLSEESLKLSTMLHDEMVSAAGAPSAGIKPLDTMTAVNWSKVPMSLLEIGYMTNREEDLLLADPLYQDKLIQGMVTGIARYFEDKEP